MALDDEFVMNPLEPAATVVLLGELWNERRCTRRDDFSRDYVRAFLVRTIDRHSAGRVASLCLGLPAIQDGYTVFGDEVDLEAKLTDIDAEPHNDHRHLWKVTAKYTSKPQNHPDYQHNSPITRRARRTTKYQRDKGFADHDKDGLPIANSAGQPFDPVETSERYQVISYRKNLAAEFPDVVEQFLDATNSTAAFGKPAYSLLVDDFVQDDEQFENGVRFWPSTLTLHCKAVSVATPKPWHYRPLDQGTYQRLGGMNFSLKDAVGRPIGKGLLNGTGLQLAFGGIPVYQDFRLYPEIDFAPLVALFLP